MATEYDLTVVSNRTLSPSMRRLVVGGAELEAFPAGQESGYVKLMLSQDGAESRPVLRSYTIRHHDARRAELTLDVVDHGDAGPASAWARRARPGEPVRLRGPGEKKLANPEADWFLLAGDLSALPALAVNLERLPRSARGYALIEVPSEADRQALDHPPGIELTWLINPDGQRPNAPLIEAVLDCRWQSGTPYPWFAGEFDAMRRIRRYFRDERGIDKRAMYVSCYWKLGATDEEMKTAKRLDADG